MVDVCPFFIALDSLYRDLNNYIQEGYFLEHWNPKQRRELRLKSALYQIIDGVLFRKNYDGVFHRCLEHEHANKVVVELHDGPARGHFFLCNCNFEMYSPMYLMSCTMMFIPGCVYNVIESSHASMFRSGGSIM